MAARTQAGYHRQPRTTQERRRNIRDREFTRGKRRNIPNAWDDISIRRQKSWKKKRNTQYRGDKDGFSYWKIEFNRYYY